MFSSGTEMKNSSAFLNPPLNGYFGNSADPDEMAHYGNSEDPEEMPHNAAFLQGLHCLLKTKWILREKCFLGNYHL